jgi:hypothetical protein
MWAQVSSDEDGRDDACTTHPIADPAPLSFTQSRVPPTIRRYERQLTRTIHKLYVHVSSWLPDSIRQPESPTSLYTRSGAQYTLSAGGDYVHKRLDHHERPPPHPLPVHLYQGAARRVLYVGSCIRSTVGEHLRCVALPQPPPVQAPCPYAPDGAASGVGVIKRTIIKKGQL